MTRLLAAGGLSQVIASRDLTMLPAWHWREDVILSLIPDYISPWWGRRGLGLSDESGQIGGGWFESPDLVTGSSYRFGFAGITRDAAGGILGGVTCKLFETATDTLIQSTVSDPATGEYLLTSHLYPDPHYIVFYKAGTPDVFATTPNSLIGG